MIKVDEKERIRKEYFTKRQSIREIAREFHHAKNSKEGSYGSLSPSIQKKNSTTRTSSRAGKAYHR